MAEIERAHQVGRSVIYQCKDPARRFATVGTLPVSSPGPDCAVAEPRQPGFDLTYLRRHCGIRTYGEAAAARDRHCTSIAHSALRLAARTSVACSGDFTQRGVQSQLGRHRFSDCRNWAGARARGSTDKTGRSRLLST